MDTLETIIAKLIQHLIELAKKERGLHIISYQLKEKIKFLLIFHIS